MKRPMIFLALFVTIGILASLSGPAQAQEWRWGVAYGFAAPVGNTREFADDFSWRNISIEGRRVFPDRNMSVGLTASWNVFAEDGYRTSQLPGVDGALSGYQYRYTNAFPLYLNAHYYLGRPYGPRPFVGLNLGTIIMDERIEVGLVAVSETNWHLAGAPEVGVVIPHGRQTWFLSGRYHAAAAAGSFSNQGYFTLSLGLTGY